METLIEVKKGTFIFIEVQPNKTLNSREKAKKTS